MVERALRSRRDTTGSIMSPLRYIYPAADAPWKPATYGKEDGLGGLRDGIQGEQCQCRLFISALNICNIPLPLEVK